MQGQGAFPAFSPVQPAAEQPQPTAAPAGGSDAGGSNPFAAAAGANPFAAAAAANPFSAASATVFKPKDPKAIIDDDDFAPVDFGAIGASKKKKQKSAAELAAEKARADAEASAKLSYKGKPSSFFIMDYLPGDPTDPTGGYRVPTAE